MNITPSGMKSISLQRVNEIVSKKFLSFDVNVKIFAYNEYHLQRTITFASFYSLKTRLNFVSTNSTAALCF